VGKEKTFAVRGGRQDQYPYTVAPNPNTQSQQHHRGVFRLAQLAWKVLSSADRAAYNERAADRVGMMGVNLFTAEYIREYNET